ncbi:MAG: HD domain-containing protein [Ignavibacteriaceae bacterium]|nr:HD domain-containing protein [Ignavibacteriaceae bacterium]
MLNQTDLNLLKKGDFLNHFLLLKKSEIKLTKSGKQYLYLELADRTLSLSSNLWENFSEIYSNIKPGDVVKVTGSMDEYLGTPQIKITTLTSLDPGENISPTDFLAKSKRNIVEMKKELLARIQLIKNSKLKTLMDQFFYDKELEKFVSAPAGKYWHHPYLHGLLEHSLELIRICDLMCDIHPEINRDLVICGALMHDYGKTEELSFDSSFDYTTRGKLIGHIVISAMMINEGCKKIPDFPDELRDCLLHVVLSHQGKLEFASPVIPKTLEAITLYQADELSAKVNAYKTALGDLKEKGKWTKYLPLASTDLFNHGILE